MPLDVYKCWMCGKPVQVDWYEPQKRVYCEGCETKHREQYKKTVSEYTLLKLRVMHERALRMMETAGCYMHEYVDIAQQVLQEALQNTDQFQSADEFAAAMVLTSNGYQYEMQKPVAKYKVDFYIPELFICLEIDGEMHEIRTDKDSKRDVDIRHELGEKWEVIRIPTKYLEQNPEALPEAIEASYKQKKKYRKDNCGFLPNSYSKRQAAYYKDAMLYNTVRVPK